MLVLFINYISRPWYSICSKRRKVLINIVRNPGCYIGAFIPRTPTKMFLPRFSGDTNLEHWIFWAELYFTYLGFDEKDWLPLPCFYLDGAALTWFTSLFRNKQFYDWKHFKEKFAQHFPQPPSKDRVGHVADSSEVCFTYGDSFPIISQSAFVSRFSASNRFSKSSSFESVYDTRSSKADHVFDKLPVKCKTIDSLASVTGSTTEIEFPQDMEMPQIGNANSVEANLELVPCSIAEDQVFDEISHTTVSSNIHDLSAIFHEGAHFVTTVAKVSDIERFDVGMKSVLHIAQPEEVQLFEAHSPTNLSGSVSTFETGQSMDGTSSIIAFRPGSPDPHTLHDNVTDVKAILKIFVDMKPVALIEDASLQHKTEDAKYFVLQAKKETCISGLDDNNEEDDILTFDLDSQSVVITVGGTMPDTEGHVDLLVASIFMDPKVTFDPLFIENVPTPSMLRHFIFDPGSDEHPLHVARLFGNSHQRDTSSFLVPFASQLSMISTMIGQIAGIKLPFDDALWDLIYTIPCFPFDPGATFFMVPIRVTSSILCVWDLEISFEVMSLTGYSMDVEALQLWGCSGMFFLSAHTNSMPRVWDPGKSGCVNPYIFQSGSALSPHFTHSYIAARGLSSYLPTLAPKANILTWRRKFLILLLALLDENKVRHLDMHTLEMCALTFIVSASFGTLLFWNVDSGLAPTVKNLYSNVFHEQLCQPFGSLYLFLLGRFKNLAITLSTKPPVSISSHVLPQLVFSMSSGEKICTAYSIQVVMLYTIGVGIFHIGANTDMPIRKSFMNDKMIVTWIAFWTAGNYSLSIPWYTNLLHFNEDTLSIILVVTTTLRICYMVNLHKTFVVLHSLRSWTKHRTMISNQCSGLENKPEHMWLHLSSEIVITLPFNGIDAKKYVPLYESDTLLLLPLLYLNLEDKVLIEEGSIVVNLANSDDAYGPINWTKAGQAIGPGAKLQRGQRISRPNKRFIWDPG